MLKSLWIEYCTHKILSPRQTCLLSYGFGQSRWWFMGVIFFSLGWVHFCTIGVIWGKLTAVNLNSYAGGKRIVNYLMLPRLLTFPRRVQLTIRFPAVRTLRVGQDSAAQNSTWRTLPPQGVGASLWPWAGMCSSRTHLPNHRDCGPAAHPSLSSLLNILQRSEPK